MSEIVETIDVDVPVRVAYDQWTQFEEFPKFMEAVERVEQLDDTTLRWTAEVAGVLFNTDPIDGALDISSIVVATIGAVITVLVVGAVTGRNRVGRGPV